MKKSFLSLLLASFILIGCDSGSSTSTSSTSSTAPSTTGGANDAKKLRVGLVFDSGGIGDKSFNDSAYAGLQKAEQELGVEGKTIQSQKAKDYQTNINAFAEQGFDLVVAVGSTQAVPLKAVATKFKDVKFVAIDETVDLPNVRSLKFNEEQGSFMAGYLAGLVTKTNTVGFVGGMKLALIEKFEAGYAAGAKAANPNVTVLPGKYTNSWSDVGLGKAAARTLFDQGADIVYHASGRCGLGVIEAAKETNKLAIGVDGNQDGVAPGFVLTSMVKHVDVALFETIKDLKEGKFTGETRSYDYAKGGVGLTDFEFTKDKIGAENLKKVEEMGKRVASGEVKPPLNLTELANFKLP